MANALFTNFKKIQDDDDEKRMSIATGGGVQLSAIDSDRHKSTNEKLDEAEEEIRVSLQSVTMVSQFELIRHCLSCCSSAKRCQETRME